MDSDATAEPAGSSLTPLPSGRFSGREAFEQLIRDAFIHAASEGWQEIIISDATFEDWPLRERSVVDSLQVWSQSGRRLIMLATRYDEVLRRHARFVAWRKTWGHLIECRVCRAAAPSDFPSAISSKNWFMHRLDLARSLGVCGDDRERGVQLREQLNEKIRNSSPGFPSSTLGL